MDETQPVQTVPKRLPLFWHEGKLTIILLLAAAFILGNAVCSGRLHIPMVNNGYKPVSGLPEDLQYEDIEKVYDQLRTNYDGKLSEGQIKEGLKKGLARSTGDPYTEYYTAKQAKEFSSQLSNTFSGIGAELGKDKDDNIIIVSPIAGFPAEKAGLKPQDIIVTVDGKSTTGLAIDEAVSKIRGPKGTDVKLQVVRDKKESLEFKITRDTIKIESVKQEILDGNIGYISISNFSDDTAQLVTTAAEDFKSKNVKGIILDLRGNPGGLLDSSVDVSGIWLPSGKVVLQEKRDGKVVISTEKSAGPATLDGIPTVVLINEGSASASEIVAGALRDNKAAHLIGVKTYGKGVVQQTICIGGTRQADGSCSNEMLKVTVASWYTPSGKSINHEGIKPDQEVKPGKDDTRGGPDAQKDAAIKYLQSKSQ